MGCTDNALAVRLVTYKTRDALSFLPGWVSYCAMTTWDICDVSVFCLVWKGTLLETGGVVMLSNCLVLCSYVSILYSSRAAAMVSICPLPSLAATALGVTKHPPRASPKVAI
ncbi:hypothetical protein L1049_019624 [Liquidambar formosana]|uniref:Uncharacterized protein n=1 Tax=Liquidambar formosana TaxID=63359 RepID=A0AAP0S658_LIQFO